MHLHKTFMVALSLFVAFGYSEAHAQLDQPWGFKAQNRASIASLIKQVEDGPIGSSAGNLSASAIPSQDITTLVCGSDGASSAKGNSTCIILNNASGGIDLAQDVLGDQSASSVTPEGAVTEESGGADEVLTALEGDGLTDLSGDNNNSLQ